LRCREVDDACVLGCKPNGPHSERDSMERFIFKHHEATDLMLRVVSAARIMYLIVRGRFGIAFSVNAFWVRREPLEAHGSFRDDYIDQLYEFLGAVFVPRFHRFFSDGGVTSVKLFKFMLAGTLS